MDDPFILLALFFVALIAGKADAFGGGGGLLTMPGLLAFGVPPHVALGTNALIGLLGSWDVWHYIQKKQLPWKMALPILFFAVLGSYAGTQVVLAIPEEILKTAFVILLPLMGIFLFTDKVKDIQLQDSIKRTQKPLTKTGPTGFLIAFYDTIFPPGAGIIKVLILRKALQIPYINAVAISRLACVIAFMMGVMVYAFEGNILWHVGLIMAPGYALGTYISSHWVLKGGDKLIRKVLIGLFIILMGYVAYNWFFN